MRKDLIEHLGLFCFLQFILYPMAYSFPLLIGLGIAKEYGAFEFVYRILGDHTHKESKDVDDICADYLGCCLGWLMGGLIW